MRPGRNEVGEEPVQEVVPEHTTGVHPLPQGAEGRPARVERLERFPVPVEGLSPVGPPPELRHERLEVPEVGRSRRGVGLVL